MPAAKVVKDECDPTLISAQLTYPKLNKPKRQNDNIKLVDNVDRSV